MEGKQNNSFSGGSFTGNSPKNSGYLPFLFLIIFFLICTCAYLAYQNIGLRQQLGQMPSGFYNSTDTNSNTPTPAPAQNSNDIQNWKTFVDEDKNFSIVYPSNWTVITNKINTSLDKNGTLQPEDVVYFTEKEFYTGSVYNYGRLHIIKLGTTKESSVEKWFDAFSKNIGLSVPANLTPGKESIIFSFSNTEILSTSPVFNNQKYFFITNGTVYGIDANFIADYKGIDAPKNQALKTIYNRMITSLGPALTPSP